jgi:hypothetical protein
LQALVLVILALVDACREDPRKRLKTPLIKAWIAATVMAVRGWMRTPA